MQGLDLAKEVHLAAFLAELKTYRHLTGCMHVKRLDDLMPKILPIFQGLELTGDGGLLCGECHTLSKLAVHIRPHQLGS